MSLFLGSALAAVPLLVAVLIHRAHENFSVPNELGLLLVGVILLASFVWRRAQRA